MYLFKKIARATIYSILIIGGGVASMEGGLWVGGKLGYDAVPSALAGLLFCCVLLSALIGELS